MISVHWQITVCLNYVALLNCEFYSYIHVLLFQRCIIIGIYHFSLKQVYNGKCTTAVRGSLGYIPV